ncbi:23S rRNA (uracil(1939)-C(5))-methyltransferase RlmD [Fusibacter sp. JL216-2]|uniref:23S rRNA (uracil(1939)-C(5))-methyltransferase RlmD n=1 Tax=Fusibacter sp. JL216-2 TaxID=3071453 RepID=UPI003D32CD13
MSIPVQKNEYIELDIVSLGEAGEGIGRVDGFTIFVHGAVPGDKVKAKLIKVKKTYAVGKLDEVIKSSEDRVDPPCPYVSQCGGCQIQHIDYKAQLAYKREFVQSAMDRIGKIDVEVLPTIGMDEPFRYRNKGQYPVGGTTDQPKIGFFKARTHEVIDVDVCRLQSTSADKAVSIIRQELPKLGWPIYNEKTHKGFLRHVLIRTAHKTGDMMVVFVVKGNKLRGAQPLIDRLLAEVPEIKSIILNENKSKGNRVLGFTNKTIWGSDKITDYIKDLSFEISPLSFFQVNPVQTEKLYSKALEYAELTGDETVFDIYCGIGSISLFLAQKAKLVVGVEIVEDAIKDAQANAKRNGFDNTDFHTGAAETIIPELYKKGYKADVVVVDPPRKGCDEIVLKTIADMAPKRVVYVSCKPSTLARDLRILEDLGYKTVKVQPVDMFAHTGHVETVCELELKK